MKFVTASLTTTCSKPAAAPCNEFVRSPTRSLHTCDVVLGSRPAPNVIQPARPQQAASSRATLWPEEPLARSYKLGIFTTALPAQSPMRLRPGMWSPVSLRGDSRPSRGSAALTFPTSGFSTERVGGPHARSQMHGRLRRRCRAEEDRSPAFVPRAASAERYDSTCYRVTLHAVCKGCQYSGLVYTH